MADFPTGLDTLINPSGVNNLDNPDHPEQHANANDIVEALEAKVGIDSSAVVTSHDFLIRNLPEQEGTLKLANDTALEGRNSGDSAYINLVKISSSNDMDLGGTGVGTIFPANPMKMLDTFSMNGKELYLGTTTSTSITSDTSNQIDIKINSADDFKFTANTFTALSGSTIVTNTIAETTGGSGVTIDGLVIKDAAGAGFLKTVTYYTSDEIWTKPSGLKFIIIKARGGGGGGGGIGPASGTSSVGGGGQGELSTSKIAVDSLGAMEDVTVGIGGAGGIGTNDGATGATSSLGSLITAIGGSGGVGGTGADGTGKLGGNGGGGGTADFVIRGTPGGASNSDGNTFVGGVGGGEGGANARNTIGNGLAGVRGGGGSGSVTSGTTSRTGGAGGAGWVIINEYF